MRLSTRFWPTRTPMSVSALGDAEDAAHRGDGIGDRVRLNESDVRSTIGFTTVSRANQAAGLPNMSRSSWRRRLSRRKRVNSASSMLVGSPGRSPRSAADCDDPVTHRSMGGFELRNEFAYRSAVLASATILAQYSGEYGLRNRGIDGFY